MAYRTIEIDWMPQSHAQWATFGAARREAARLWGDLVKRHHRLRRLNWHWPSKARGRYPGLSAQATQQIIGEFCEAVNATRHLRKNGHREARYPWRTPRYWDVVYTNQDARVREGWLLLPNGRSGTLRIPLPRHRPLPGRLMEARLCLGRILLVCQVDDVPRPQQTVIGVDLGVNTLLAATDGQTVLLVSGREAKATVQWRNKKLASLSQRQARLTKGSRRWKRLQRRKAKMRAKARRRLADLVHKATRQVAAAFPGATCYVGAPFNDAAQDLAPRPAQTVSQACNARLIGQLDYKTCGAIEVNEAYTSQTCPRCGRRRRCRRTYRCPCGIVAPRDVVGATNILSVGRHGSIHPDTPLPTVVLYAPLLKYPGVIRVVRADTPEIARRARVHASTPRSPRLKSGECHMHIALGGYDLTRYRVEVRTVGRNGRHVLSREAVRLRLPPNTETTFASPVCGSSSSRVRHSWV